ncbi:Hypothetical_protein [Hexamita inflata]|uniref:Hypothetical_protein n=1 Tax=Hexamita inflata TaxID=28002 RepID=A0AA86RTQ7_9EUKA|nr:Hypothetical protein HINF_LOCUS65527 [Hexamita inflata]
MPEVRKSELLVLFSNATDQFIILIMYKLIILLSQITLKFDFSVEVTKNQNESETGDKKRRKRKSGDEETKPEEVKQEEKPAEADDDSKKKRKKRSSKTGEAGDAE